MIPAPHSITVKRQQLGAVDAHGNPTVTYSTPETIAVHGIAPGASAESVAAGRNVDSVAWTVYAPAGTVIAAADVVTVAGVDYEVNGDSLDWTRGPWPNAAAGVVIELRRRSG